MFLRGCNITGVQRTMRSFSASSSSVWIQPWSRSILRRLRMCLNCTHHPTDCQHTICSPGMTPCIALHNLYAANAVHAASEHAHACMWMPPLFQGVYKGKVGALRPATKHASEGELHGGEPDWPLNHSCTMPMTCTGSARTQKASPMG